MSPAAYLWRSSATGVGIVLLSLLASACGGRTDVEDLSVYEDDAGVEDAKPDIQYDVLPDSKTCNPQLCPTGCCDVNGVCRPGTAAEACGTGGYVCVNCSPYGAKCDSQTHTCVDVKLCSPSTCSGCCLDAYTCVGGSDSTSCGKGGVACQNCLGMGKTCSGSTGTCTSTPKCGPSTCSGCCDANDQCRDGASSDFCGAGGGMCSNCSASGMQCDPSAKFCVSTGCNPSNCSYGCCDPYTGQCSKGMDQFQCGSGGAICQQCGSGQQCQPSWNGGTCQTTSDCGAWNCAGCCDFSTWPPSCLSGYDPWACGSQGNTCQYCASPGQQCTGGPAGGQCQQTGECGPDTCPWGCCDPNTWPMQCVGGIDPWACGSNGQTCQNCSGAGQQCEATYSGGMCTQTGCGPWNCPGCCDQYGQCLPGYDLKQCGAGGQQCNICGPNQKCSSGSCVGDSTCNASNCPGCCDQTVYPPVCLGGYEWNKCGVSGQACFSCGAPDAKCDMGTCISPTECGPSNCGGCCNYSTWPPTCQGGFDPYACGYGGSACEMCPGGSKCEPTPAGGGICAAAQDCGPWNCSGCCDYNSYPPTCYSGLDAKYCGAFGDSCQTCPASQTCTVIEGGIGGTCSTSQTCGAWNCSGCCDANGKCQLGTYSSECGSGGASCKACTSEQTCSGAPGGGGVCTGSGACGPSTCSGCCDWNGTCRTGDINSLCGISGEQCTNCLVSNQICDPAAGNCVSVPNCGPLNCAGCCRLDGTCSSGYSGNECGHGGTLCENCGATGGVCQSGSCYGGGTPTNCPAMYPGCSPQTTNPAPVTQLGACPDKALLNGQAACSGSSAACGIWFQNLKNNQPKCYECLLPFTGPKALGTCLKPYVDPSCDHDLACSLDCINVACAQCPDASKQQCQEGVWGGACAGYLSGVYCAAAAYNQAPFCNPDVDSGTWIYQVGNHYCGTGAP